MPATVTKDQIEERLTEALVELRRRARRRSRRDAGWEELDVDSLDLVELAQIVEEEYGVQITRGGPQEHQHRRPGDRLRGGARRVVSRRVAITGVGAVTPLGVGAPALIEGWAAGALGHRGRPSAAARDFEPARAHLSVKEARRADRFTQLALVAGGEALAQAGLDDGLRRRGRSAA